MHTYICSVAHAIRGELSEWNVILPCHAQNHVEQTNYLPGLFLRMTDNVREGVKFDIAERIGVPGYELVNKRLVVFYLFTIFLKGSVLDLLLRILLIQHLAISLRN